MQHDRLEWHQAKQPVHLNLGNRFVTDADGRAQFTTPVSMEKIWQWVPVGFTPFSIPARADHLPVTGEPIQVIPAAADGRLYARVPASGLPIPTSDGLVLFGEG